MGNVTVNEVQNLNKRIEKLNTERTRVESQSELLKKQLNELISEYASDFGTDLHGKTLSECKNLIMAESKKVFDAVKEEYDLKEKIVSLIEKGDIDEANILLGIKPEVEEVAEEDNSISSEEDNNEELDLQVDEGVEFDESSFQMSLGLENQEESAVSNLDLGLKTEEVVEEEPESFKIAFDGDLDVEDDSDDSDESDAFVAEDDDDDFDFGFGDMLKGGKF